MKSQATRTGAGYSKPEGEVGQGAVAERVESGVGDTKTKGKLKSDCVGHGNEIIWSKIATAYR